MNPFHSGAFGGVKLQVKESDVKKAVRILRQEPSKFDSTDDTDVEDGDQPL
jgi:hypothetical protein